MSLSKAIAALEVLPQAELLAVLALAQSVLVGRAERAPVAAGETHSDLAHLSPEERKRELARRRSARRRSSSSVTLSVTERDGERDASRSSVTASVTERDAQRDAGSGLARGPSEVPSESSPSVLKDRNPQSRSESVSDARVSVTRKRDGERDASRVTERDERDGESVTQQAERARVTIAAAYRARGLAVPRQVASLASTADTVAALAGLPAGALLGILERFFNDHAMKAKGYPVAFLLTNANQWAIDGIARDDGAPRERPAETVLPDWMRQEGAA